MTTSHTIKVCGRLLVVGLLSAAQCSCTSVKATGTYSLSGSPITYTSGGQGEPVVVFETGLGNSKEVWDLVLPAVERTHAVFAYDRPGYGGSAPVAGHRDACTVATEEHSLLHSKGIAPPYILVGHSIGGLYEYVYTKLYPQDVMGVVLVDPTPPGHLARMQREAPEDLAAMTEGIRALNDTERREWDDMDACLEQIDTTTPLSVPVRVLVETRREPTRSDAFGQMMQRNHQYWGRLAGRPAEEVAGSGHFIQRERPQSVIDAIAAVSREISPHSKTN